MKYFEFSVAVENFVDSVLQNSKKYAKRMYIKVLFWRINKC